jgi:hypothetical protein
VAAAVLVVAWAETWQRWLLQRSPLPFNWRGAEQPLSPLPPKFQLLSPPFPLPPPLPQLPLPFLLLPLVIDCCCPCCCAIASAVAIAIAVTTVIDVDVASTVAVTAFS